MKKITLIAQLYLHPNQEDGFYQFETAATRVMAKHGGKITQRFVLPSPKEQDTPDEIHIVTFPNKAAFEAYRLDEEIQALGSLRADSIRKTIVWTATEAPPFSNE